MKKLPKRPRTFGRTKYKPHKKKRQSRFLNARFSKIIDKMIDSPAYWYYIKYDENGKYASVGIDFDMPGKERSFERA